MQFHHFTFPPQKKKQNLDRINFTGRIGILLLLFFLRRVLQPGSINVDGSRCIRYRSQLVDYNKHDLVGGNSNIYVYFHPENWEDGPILTHIFERG